MQKTLVTSLITILLGGLATTAIAGPVASTSAGTFAGAQSVNGFFTLDANPNILDSTTIPHVEITQSGHTGNGFDYYSFSHSGGTVHLDMDGPSNTDMEIGIWTSTGVFVAANDDNGGDPGSDSGLNSALFNLNLAAGDYVVGVCEFNCSFGSNGVMTGNGLDQGDRYVFNISANTVPEPASLALVLVACAAGCVPRRRSN